MKRTRGFTLVELLVVITIIALLITLLLPSLARVRRNAASAADANNVGQIHKAMLAYADSDNGRYPLPGRINRLAFEISPTGGGQEIPGKGPENKFENKTKWVYSAMIAQDMITTKVVISPVEQNRFAAEKENYDFTDYDPDDDSYWDPTFRMSPQQQFPGSLNCSYTTLCLTGIRKESMWRSTGSSFECVLGNRGTEDGAIDGPAFEDSLTLQFHQPEGEWGGNLAFNDGHVSLARSVYPDGVAYDNPDGITEADNIFAAEFGDGDEVTAWSQGDVYLGVFDNVVGEDPSSLFDWEPDVEALYDPLLP